jgi:hypothetical protein
VAESDKARCRLFSPHLAGLVARIYVRRYLAPSSWVTDLGNMKPSFTSLPNQSLTPTHTRVSVGHGRQPKPIPDFKEALHEPLRRFIQRHLGVVVSVSGGDRNGAHDGGGECCGSVRAVRTSALIKMSSPTIQFAGVQT